MEPITIGSIFGGVGKMIGMGACLAVGFWAAKKLTDKVDIFIASHSAEFKELVAGMVTAEENKQKEQSLDKTVPTSAII